MEIQLQFAFKMIPFKTTKWTMTWLCMCPTTKSWNKRKKLIRAVLTLTIIALILCMLVAHLVYFLKFMSVNLGDSLFALMNVIAISDILYGMIVEFFLRHQIGAIFKKLSMIYKASKSTYLIIINILKNETNKYFQFR